MGWRGEGARKWGRKVGRSGAGRVERGVERGGKRQEGMGEKGGRKRTERGEKRGGNGWEEGEEGGNLRGEVIFLTCFLRKPAFADT